MWQTDKVYLQTLTEVNTYGSKAQSWKNSTAVRCDIQDISSNLVYRDYGFTQEGQYKQIFDHTQANWVVGNQVSIDSEQWLIRLANGSNNKMGSSNHTYVIVSKVI